MINLVPAKIKSYEHCQAGEDEVQYLIVCSRIGTGFEFSSLDRDRALTVGTRLGLGFVKLSFKVQK